jgi:single-stranded-DNA-specific exonuclease
MGIMKEYVVRERKEGESLVAHLLRSRNIEEKFQEEFLKPDYSKGTHDPFLMKNMDRTVERVLKAIKDNEMIMIYSDYDADGIPGAVVFHDFFKLIAYTNTLHYIPHRHKEGYGFHEHVIDEAKEKGVTLIITVDCGISGVSTVAKANKVGIDVIITDHHEVGKVAPPAYAILDPKQDGETYPFKELCGSGVAYKLVQALYQKGDFDVKPGMEKWSLDMVGIATVADMVPLVDENRVLAVYGLQVLRMSRRPGIQALCKKLQLKQDQITEGDIGFSIGPRINAASRMAHPIDAFNLFITEDEVEAKELALHLEKLNTKRKTVVATTTKEVKRHIKELGELKEVILLGNPSWSPALLGLVAGRIAEEHERPVFLWGRENEKIKGSCRGYGDVSVVEIMSKVSDELLHFGGHHAAGGFALDQEKLHFLEDKLVEAFNELKTEEKQVEKIYIEDILSPEKVDYTIFNEVAQLAPFGMGNKNPLFLFANVTPKEVAQFGKHEEHLKIIFERMYGRALEAIGFFMHKENMPALEGDTFNLVATLEKSTFRGYTNLRLRIVDVY